MNPAEADAMLAAAGALRLGSLDNSTLELLGTLLGRAHLNAQGKACIPFSIDIENTGQESFSDHTGQVAGIADSGDRTITIKTRF